MKKIKYGILAAAVCAAMLCGCQAKNAATETEVPADTNAAAEETIALADTDSAAEEDSDDAITQETADSNAKILYTNASAYATKCELKEMPVSVTSAGGSIGERISDFPEFDGTEADLRMAVGWYMGGEDSGYYYIEFEGGYPTRTMWSPDPAFGEAVENGQTSDFDEGLLIGYYSFES